MDLKFKNIKKSAKNALSGSVDQVLLGFHHSGLSRVAANLKEVPGAAGSVDLVTRIGQSVLNRAGQVRSQLVATVIATAGRARSSPKRSGETTKSATKGKRIIRNRVSVKKR